MGYGCFGFVVWLDVRHYGFVGYCIIGISSVLLVFVICAWWIS